MYNNYFENVYSKFWTETSKAYGLEDGVDSIIEILQQLHGESAFEVGIGWHRLAHCGQSFKKRC